MISLDDNIHIHKGIGLKYSSEVSSEPKHFVFDLDETIGSFSDLYILVQATEQLLSNCDISPVDKSSLVHELLDLYPEFFRYGIEIVMEYLFKKKNDLGCGVYLYTNNICLPESWSYFITSYIEKKWNLHGLFDKVIRAFKINGRIVEHNRTTNEKTYNDLLHCLILPRSTDLCFIDDVIHPKMKHRYVYYIQPRKYTHCLNNSEIISRFLKSKTGILLNEHLDNNLDDDIRNWYKQNNYSFDNYDIPSLDEFDMDLKVSKELLKYIRKMFRIIIRRPYTQRSYNSPVNVTQKLRTI